MNWIAGYKQHYKALIFLGLPIVIGQVGVIILGFADTLMIGHHSTEELGAASFVNNVFTLCIIFSTGFSYGRLSWAVFTATAVLRKRGRRCVAVWWRMSWWHCSLRLS